MNRTDYDSPWKNILNHFLPAFMEFCFSDTAWRIDWSRGYTSLDKELQAISRLQAVGKRIADTLFKVWLNSGEEVWLLLHLEIQAQEETHFPERMYIYNYRIFDRYRKSIMSVAILADDDPSWHPTHYARSSWHNELYFKFATVKLLDYAHQKTVLEQNTNPFAIVIWAHLEALETRRQPPLRLQSKLAVTRALYEHGFSKDYILNLFYFIDWVLALPEPLELEYTKSIEQFEEEKRVDYVTSVERIGWRQGERSLLLHLLQRRFGALSPDLQKQLEKAPSDQLLLWSERLLDAETLADIFECDSVQS